MSASDKKKLRREQKLDMLTARQQQEQAEAKKLKTYTIVFVAIMALVAVIAVSSLIVGEVNKSGVIEKNTIAASIGDEQLNTVQLSYYYNDAISEMYDKAYEQYSSYYELYFETMGLDIHAPLDEQVQDKETGATWADYFVNAALESAKSDYTMEKLAAEAGFQLPEAEAANIDTYFTNLDINAKLSGYSSANAYLRMVYGSGADTDSYREHLTRIAIADAFYTDHMDNLKYDDAAIREYEKDRVNNYNSYDYSYSYLSYTGFLQGGTEDENGTVTYSDEEKAAAREAVKQAAAEMATATTLDELKEKAEAVEVNEDSEVAVNTQTRALHTSINLALADWMAADERKEGDIAAIPNATTPTDGEESVVNGYYVVYFTGRSDNKLPMSDVRHLLVSFQGGTTDPETDEVVYSEEEKNTAKATADDLLTQWKEGEATEESFIALIKEHSDDTTAADGGLFENINIDSQYVPNFLNWSMNADRKAGDIEVIETEFGYHIMYYVGASQLNYRDYMITSEMQVEDQQKWYDAALEAVTAEKLDVSRLNLDMIISPNA